jgi:hypothetical protein
MERPDASAPCITVERTTALETAAPGRACQRLPRREVDLLVLRGERESRDKLRDSAVFRPAEGAGELFWTMSCWRSPRNSLPSAIVAAVWAAKPVCKPDSSAFIPLLISPI